MLSRGLYVSNVDLNDSTYGVAKKIQMQLEAFNNAGLNMQYSSSKKIYHNVIGQKIISRLPFSPFGEKWTGISVSDVDFLYIRKSLFDIEFYRFVKKAKKSGVKRIVLEIPTYPYDLEMRKRWQTRPYYWKDCFYRRRISPFVDRIATYSTDETIFGVKTVRIINGLDFSKINDRLLSKAKNDEVHLLCVANMSFWHGYDRLLYGLAEYYSSSKTVPDVKVYMHLVGEGSETAKYKLIVKENDISNYVFFHGSLSGHQLDEVYNNCDIGICSLGCHRKNLELTSELKTREYAAKGLPMVTSCEIDIFPDKYFDFIKMFPADESIISIFDILNWYHDLLKINESVEVLSSRIRSLGEQLCDINETMKPIIEYIND